MEDVFPFDVSFPSVRLSVRLSIYPNFNCKSKGDICKTFLTLSGVPGLCLFDA